MACGAWYVGYYRLSKRSKKGIQRLHGCHWLSWWCTLQLRPCLSPNGLWKTMENYCPKQKCIEMSDFKLDLWGPKGLLCQAPAPATPAAPAPSWVARKHQILSESVDVSHKNWAPKQLTTWKLQATVLPVLQGDRSCFFLWNFIEMLFLPRFEATKVMKESDCVWHKALEQLAPLAAAKKCGRQSSGRLLGFNGWKSQQ